ncbi:thymidylate kinase [Salinisphaera shabanensis T35B1]|uniref:dTMP kinase n=1 Tax=Salinisphaera shabanensis TaxID=180542 RepID=UPI0033404563
MAAPNQAGPAGGTFITFEGGEGVGKSTHTRCIGHLLRQAGHTVTVTREPGGGAVGESVRDLLMQNFEPAMPAMSELLLLFAARAGHLEQVIEPVLARGEIVLCDRFTDTSYAYQGITRGLGVDAVSKLEGIGMATVLRFCQFDSISYREIDAIRSDDAYQCVRYSGCTALCHAFLDLHSDRMSRVMTLYSVTQAGRPSIGRIGNQATRPARLNACISVRSTSGRRTQYFPLNYLWRISLRGVTPHAMTRWHVAGGFFCPEFAS